MPTNRPVPRPLCLQPGKPSGSPPAGAQVCRARPVHTCPKGLTPLAPHTRPLPTNTPSRPHPRFPFPRGPDPDSTPTRSKPGMASPSAPNIWRPPFSQSPGSPLCSLRSLSSSTCSHLLSRCFQSQPLSVAIPVPPPHNNHRRARSQASPACLTYGQGRRSTISPAGQPAHARTGPHDSMTTRYSPGL